MKALKQILKNSLKSLGVQYRKYDPADPFNVPREWVGGVIKLRSQSVL